MAMQETAPAPPPSAEVVGNAFVQQYYHILHQSPGLVHKFYQDVSLLSRPDSDGNMTTVSTMQAINEKILSLNYEDYTAEINYADAQESFEKGVIVLVTGCLTGKDNVQKKFSQTFFLAPQDKGYFVLNDVFRFLEENESLPTSTLVNGVNEDVAPIASTRQPGWGDIVEADHSETLDHTTVAHNQSFENEDANNGAEVHDLSDKEEGSVVEDEAVEFQTDDAMHSEILTSVDSAAASLEDAPKKSYASILKLMKGNAASHSVHAVNSNSKVPRKLPSSAKPVYVPAATAPTTGNAPESNDAHEEVEGHSIYVRNLPFNATEAQLDEAFKKFGPIKGGGIQVRSNKQGFCFGFVEFETLASMQSALEASPISIGDREAIIEEKKTNTRVGSSGRGRYSSGRGGFRSESFKNRGNYGGGGGRGYGRSEFRNQAEFAGRPKGSTGRNADDNQRNMPNGSRRASRQTGGVKGSSVPT
ncbi:Nuclear transport factor 2 (NTF2) family protein with RNA binding (RRM-RBD-RNP motifs) domain [Euphorbia peplus]|nr:Nuclear transport factor 2 (NTF2) family protein with RNA binding (RRM-RBD-RNP motifs) domain [Euphorbia peplus]